MKRRRNAQRIALPTVKGSDHVISSHTNPKSADPLLAVVAGDMKEDEREEATPEPPLKHHKSYEGQFPTHHHELESGVVGEEVKSTEEVREKHTDDIPSDHHRHRTDSEDPFDSFYFGNHVEGEYENQGFDRNSLEKKDVFRYASTLSSLFWKEPHLFHPDNYFPIRGQEEDEELDFNKSCWHLDLSQYGLLVKTHEQCWPLSFNKNRFKRFTQKESRAINPKHKQKEDISIYMDPEIDPSSIGKQLTKEQKAMLEEELDEVFDCVEQVPLVRSLMPIKGKLEDLNIRKTGKVDDNYYGNAKMGGDLSEYSLPADHQLDDPNPLVFRDAASKPTAIPESFQGIPPENYSSIQSGADMFHLDYADLDAPKEIRDAQNLLNASMSVIIQDTLSKLISYHTKKERKRRRPKQEESMKTPEANTNEPSEANPQDSNSDGKKQYILGTAYLPLHVDSDVYIHEPLEKEEFTIADHRPITPLVLDSATLGYLTGDVSNFMYGIVHSMLREGELQFAQKTALEMEEGHGPERRYRTLTTYLTTLEKVKSLRPPKSVFDQLSAKLEAIYGNLQFQSIWPREKIEKFYQVHYWKNTEIYHDDVHKYKMGVTSNKRKAGEWKLMSQRKRFMPKTQYLGDLIHEGMDPQKVAKLTKQSCRGCGMILTKTMVIRDNPEKCPVCRNFQLCSQCLNVSVRVDLLIDHVQSCHDAHLPIRPATIELQKRMEAKRRPQLNPDMAPQNVVNTETNQGDVPQDSMETTAELQVVGDQFGEDLPM